MNIQEAVALVSSYESSAAEGAYGPQSQFDPQAVNTATRIINDYAMKGGDVSGFPSAVQKYTTPEYANFVASRGSGQWRHAAVPLAIAAGGLAGVGAFGGAASGAGGAGATGTEAAGAYGAAGEFAGAGGTAAGTAGGAGT